jgi:2,4-dienoyl-CoA reductase [(3E)-enoyl-CoA-producing], peroxisomal
LLVLSTMTQQRTPFASDCLQDKVALVTGGGSGICFEVVKQLLLAGCSGAVICGRREQFLLDATSLLQQETHKAVEYFVCDVRNADTCQKLAEFVRHRFGRLDILVNGAAGNFLAPAAELSPKGFATVIAIDVLGTFNVTRAVYPLISETAHRRLDTTGVSIINISATLQYGATWWQAHASAAKSAVDSLTRSLALEWGSDRIRVNGIAPGPIANTPGMSKLAPGVDSSQINNMIKEGIPLGRLGESYEIGWAAVYLCTATYVTGHTLVVDGGEWLYKTPKVPKGMVAELSRKAEAPSRAKAPMSRL